MSSKSSTGRLFSTPLARALDETFRHPRYSSIVLEF
jgi:hypothetical protein